MNPSHERPALAEKPVEVSSGKVRLRGIVPVLLASFDPSDESLIFEDIGRQMAFLKASGIRGVALPMFGTEGYKLDDGERQEMIEHAVAAANGEMAVVGNVLNAGARNAGFWASRYAQLGVDAISFPLPRATGCNESDLLDFARRVCDSVDLPILIQDWNPGGATIDEKFCVALKTHCENFSYVKLEEPFSLPKIRRIVEETGGNVQCFDGWGALRAMQALEAGVVGLMPGPSMADVLALMFEAHTEGNWEKAMAIYESCLAQMVTALQGNLEFFIIMEKYLAWRRGLIQSKAVRSPSVRLDPELRKFGERICDRTLARLLEVQKSISGAMAMTH
jgi:dihydrodipicolinate synthase/N-acetylneuraminate lyase